MLAWANEARFPPGPNGSGIPVPEVGFDPIIGQTNSGERRFMSGTDPRNQHATLDLPEEWVISKGGEYLFTPSISALRDVFAVA